jgi:ornithine--oxo-acid transaminase
LGSKEARVAATTQKTCQDYIKQADEFGARNYAPLDVVIARGEGCHLWDVDGRRYIDFLSAYSAVNQGHGHPRIVRALVEQAQTLALTSRAFHNDRMGDMLQRIAEVTGFPKVLPMNTGAEGVETAIKAMRRWGYLVKKVPDGEAEVIVASGNFHGRTTTIVGFSDDPDARDSFGPATPGFVSVPYGDAAALARAVGPNTVGVLLEPIQGEAGVKIPPDDYLPGVRAVCTERRALLCLDEIQTGLGRTGKMFAWEHVGARPDLVVLGKALSGGLYPVSAVAGTREVMDLFTPGTHGSTYGGNPIAAAVAVAALDVIVDEGLVERAARLGAPALARLQGELTTANVREARGRGLMLAVEYRTSVAKDAVKALMKAGVLAKDTHKTTIRFAPPLVISDEQLDEALDVTLPILNRF